MIRLVQGHGDVQHAGLVDDQCSDGYQRVFLRSSTLMALYYTLMHSYPDSWSLPSYAMQDLSGSMLFAVF